MSLRPADRLFTVCYNHNGFSNRKIGLRYGETFSCVRCVADKCNSGAARARPSLSLRSLPALSTPITQARFESSVPQTDPKEKAKSILDALPGNSLLSKTAILSAGAGVSIAAISNELYVVNEESIVMFSLLTIYYAIYQYGGDAYKDWANGQRDKIKGILNSAREDHTKAVKSRIESVSDLSSVIEVTKNLFEVSKVWRDMICHHCKIDADCRTIGNRTIGGTGIRAGTKNRSGSRGQGCP